MYKKIGIVGAGTMGTAIAFDFALHGTDAVLTDIAPEALEKARAEIVKMTRFAPLLDKNLPKRKAEEVLDRIVFTLDPEDLSDCDFIVENATENWDVKAAIYPELSRICRPEVNFAVNTSCISITKIAGLTDRPERVIGVHFMNPVYLKKSVEVIRGYHTSEECLKQTQEMLSQTGKDAIVVNDLPGFVSNRVSHLFMNEAAFCVQDGVASPAQVDEIFKKCYGHKMGPLETADLIGLDTVVHSLDVLYQSYQDPKFRCCPLLRKMVDAGLLGKKSGKGFFSY